MTNNSLTTTSQRRMEHRVSDLSKAELCNQFADKLPKLVKQVCGGFRETLDDRMQSAWTELIYYAQNNQDLTLEQFIPRAMARVRGALIDEMRADDPLNRRRVVARKIDAAASVVSGRTGARATVRELAHELGLSVNQVHDLIFRVHTEATIYTTHELEESEIASFTDSVLDSLIVEQTVQRLLEAIESLSERDREVIVLRYYHNLSNREIAKRLNIGDSRATALHHRGVEKLRKFLVPA
ncbi:sigma-70 family RNA polymerase sigma factor [Burkholderia contaminans]|nr:sigma-70 family RNA polymerase sigma factor [Burkholderia contaminans]